MFSIKQFYLHLISTGVFFFGKLQGTYNWLFFMYFEVPPFNNNEMVTLFLEQLEIRPTTTVTPLNDMDKETKRLIFFGKRTF